jgi:hypothetical protein
MTAERRWCLRGFGDAGEVCLGGGQKYSWAVCEEVDRIDACLASIEEADEDWFPEDDLDVARALERDRCAGLVVLDLEFPMCA